jgi:AdoMet-dependent heme synthase
VREHDVVDVYRNHQLFKDLRDYSKAQRQMRVCEYRDVCGGQRGRAYGITGDYMETDPACAYEPKRKAG